MFRVSHEPDNTGSPSEVAALEEVVEQSAGMLDKKQNLVHSQEDYERQQQQQLSPLVSQIHMQQQQQQQQQLYDGSQSHLSLADSLADSSDGDEPDSEPATTPHLSLEHEAKIGFELVWLDLRYSVAPNVLENPRWGKVNSIFHKHPRTILKGVSGGLRSGQMVALMGPSGAGKTCLLECIAGIRRTGQEGRLCIRGRKKAQLVIVPQYDNLLPEFTVEELIAYGSQMKNPVGSNHEAIVNKVIEQLGLKACRRNRVKKCSGGQQKRVAIAQELVSKPNILILDEPTSGLDSSICYQTMKVLRQVMELSLKGDEPMAIVTTIHQPSAKVFKLFDLVYVLGKTGHFAYSGPPERLVSSLRETTALECPKFSNPADYIIELISYDYGHEPVELLVENEIEKAKQFEADFEARSNDIRKTKKNLWNKSGSIMSLALKSITSSKKQKVNSSKMINSDKNSLGANSTSLGIGMKHLNMKQVGVNKATSQSNLSCVESEFTPTRPYVTYKQNQVSDLRRATSNQGDKHPFFRHLYLHCHRSILQSIRDPILNRMRIIFHIGFAVLVVILFGRDGAKARGCPPVMGLPPDITDPMHEDIVDLSDNVGFLFMCMMLITYVSLMTMTLTFPLEVKTVCVEYRNGWYGISSFFMGKTIGDIPFILLYPLLYCLIVYFFTGQPTDDVYRPVYFTALIVLLALNSQTLGLIMGAVFVNSLTAATFLGPVSTIPWYLVTGFPKRIPALPVPLRKISRYLFTRHIFEGLLASLFGYERCNCTAWIEQYYSLRDEETLRLSRLVSAESLLALDYYDDLESSSSTKLVPAAQSAPPTLEQVWDRWQQPDLFKIMEKNRKADDLFGFGLDFEPTCPANYTSYILNEFNLHQDTLQNALITGLLTLITLRLLTFLIVSYKIRTRELG